jgi:TolA-binding protein
MTSDEQMLDASVRAFRAMTVTDGAPDATRQRVLADVEHRARRHRQVRRALAVVSAMLVVLTTGSAAWTAIGWWRGHTPPVVVIAMTGGPDAPTTTWPRPRRAIPSAPAPAAEDDAHTDDAEAAAYGRAHRAHFVDDLPGRALAAWDAYLASYPRGALAPEARFNRALCLVRLQRWNDAARALGHFARGRDGYRRSEACTLLSWLRDEAPENADVGACDSPPAAVPAASGAAN